MSENASETVDRFVDSVVVCVRNVLLFVCRLTFLYLLISGGMLSWSKALYLFLGRAVLNCLVSWQTYDLNEIAKKRSEKR